MSNTENTYKSYAAQLQSRIAKRAAKITENTMWKVGYRHLGRMSDWRDTKKVLAHLTSEQVLDKKLLKMAQEAAYWTEQEALFPMDWDF